MSNYYYYAIMQRHKEAVRERKQEYQEARRIIEVEDGAYRCFRAICNSLDDAHFTNELYQSYLNDKTTPIHLATFEPHNVDLKCLPEEKPGLLIANGSQMERQIYNDFGRFYYRIEHGPFRNWCLRPTNTGSLFEKGITHFTLEDASWLSLFCF